MRLVTRTWLAPDQSPGAGWSAEQVDAFERLMRVATAKPRGRPALVVTWDDGRGYGCWYQARVGQPERALHDACKTVFGQEASSCQ